MGLKLEFSFDNGEISLYSLLQLTLVILSSLAQKTRVRPPVTEGDVAKNPSVAFAILFFILLSLPLPATNILAQDRPGIKVPEKEEPYTAFDPLHDRYFGDFKLSTRFHARVSSNSSDNLSDLKNKLDDNNWFIGYHYDVIASIKHISSAEFFLQLRRDNISEYDAPLITDGKIRTLFGPRHTYTEAEMLPRMYRLYLDLPVTDFLDTRVRLGYFTYLVGNGYALGGKYPNAGTTLSFGPEYLRGRIHYDRVDSYNQTDWGPTIRDERAFTGKDTHADFFATDLMAKFGSHTIQPYIGFLHDYTSPKNRSNVFDNFNLNGTRVNDDLLGTVGIDLNLNFTKFNFGIEYARNFGEAHSSDKTAPDRGNITHKGWLLVTDAGYNFGLVRPKGKFVWASGPESSRSDLDNFRYHSRHNRTFSVYSPTNANIFDAHYQRAGIGPYLATASTYLLNYGVARPGVFGDPFVIENVIFLNGGLEFFPIKKMYLSVDYWNMHADEPGFGRNSAGEAVKLPSQLGHEIDFFTSYGITSRLTVNLQGGFFLPGSYYRKDRTDLFSAGDLGLSPVLPRDGRGNPDTAYLMALGLEYSF